MEQGIEREQEAVDFYELTYQAQTTLAGCCLTDDRSVGASPDRFVGTEGLLEIKCPLAPTHVSYLLADSLPDDYRLQLQGQLFVTQRQWCDFLSYYPGLPPLLVRVSPDRQVQHALAEALAEFILKLECAKAHLKELMP
jgi:hypothetical protein